MPVREGSDDTMEADRRRSGDGPRVLAMPTPPKRSDQATGESGAPAPALTFTPRQFYQRHRGRWLIEPEDALDGDTHRRAGVDG